jgi:multidrug efflux pump subunit AcrA (membrane-fusion protein)
VDAAKVEVEAARLAQSRVELRSPFDAIVIDRLVEVGTQATTGTDLLWIAGADTFWVELLVPLDDLRWVRFPGKNGEQGSTVRLVDDAWPPGTAREGRVERLISQLDPASRMARVLVRVDDPLALEPASDGAPPVLLGAYLRGEVEGRLLRDVVSISRAHLREGDYAWVIDDEDKLRIRRLETQFRGPDELVLRSGIAPGERIVTSTIRTPVEGMQLRTATGQIPAEGQ